MNSWWLDLADGGRTGLALRVAAALSIMVVFWIGWNVWDLWRRY